jgi:hypothetical protein
MLDDLVLSVQRRIDRVTRRLRRGAAPEPAGPRLLIVQIDGLSRAVLDRAMASGHTPFLKRLAERSTHCLEPMAVGVPTSTPAFQMAAMYGARPDIPGFHYFDRERQTDVHFPRRGHAADVESRQAGGRRGILQGGSAYGCIFTGGADNSLFTFSSLMRPSGRGVLAALSPFVVLGWVVLKCAARTVVVLGKAAPRLLAKPMRGHSRRWLTLQIGISVWIRGFFTMSVSRDLYAGVPAVYVNYVDYDEAGHIFGPLSRPALAALRRVDRSIRQLARVVRRVPEHRYDIYVLSDHGQVPCAPYGDLTGGERFERRVIEDLVGPASAAPADAPRAPRGLVRGIRSRRREEAALFQHYQNYVDEEFVRNDDPEAYQRGDVRVISAGPNAFLYVLGVAAPLDVEALERRFPGLCEKLSQSTGVGFVLARSPEGPVCFRHGTRHRLGESDPGPFADREDAQLVVQGIVDLMRMPSAGDLVIYGTDSAEGNVSFLPERGAHAGMAATELHTFILRPARTELPSPITHPTQLYEHFARYGAGRVTGEGDPRPVPHGDSQRRTS